MLYYNKISFMNIFRSCYQANTIITNSFDDNPVYTGASDTIIVKQKNNEYKSTPFYICFGPYATIYQGKRVTIAVNDIPITSVTFQLDFKGYITPQFLQNDQVKALKLKLGQNKISYTLVDATIEAQIFLYSDTEKIVVSDVDGTVTITDFAGLVYNYFEKQYLHQGYTDLVKKICQNGYRLLWLTMRTFASYKPTKKYLKDMTGVNGPLLTEPEDFTKALTSQFLSKTKNIKSNLLRNVKNLFPSTPFVGGFGNTLNDATAYLFMGMNLNKIFIIDTESRVQMMSDGRSNTSYREILQNIQKYFPDFRQDKSSSTTIK